MSKGHQSNDEFLSSLNDLFTKGKTKDHGSIYLTQTAMTYGYEESAEVTLENPSPAAKPLPILIRANNGKSKPRRGKKIKLSTVVEADALEGFFVRYAEVCKAGMSALKKRDKKKAKEKLKAKKKTQVGGSAVTAEVRK